MISIVVPCFNCENTLYNSLESLLGQTYTGEYQIILIDDGSIDSTPALCDDYEDKFRVIGTNGSGPQIKTFHQPNGGLMNAWKRGVKEADGEYIAFCDADDYVDADFIEQLTNVVEEHYSDIILYGMVIEYNNGEKKEHTNRLEPGYYDHERIACEVLPKLYSNGAMQSDLIIKSRCGKMIKKTLLQQIIPDLDEGVSIGEDDIATFDAVLHADSIYCMDNYFPYHYVRNNESMIGGYDPKIFCKLELCYKNKYAIADKYNYTYVSQIDADYMSHYILYVKKEICKNPGSVVLVCRRLKDFRNSEIFTNLYSKVSIKGYDLTTRIFALMFIYRFYFLLVLVTRWLDKKRGRDV